MTEKIYKSPFAIGEKVNFQFGENVRIAVIKAIKFEGTGYIFYDIEILIGGINTVFEKVDSAFVNRVE